MLSKHVLVAASFVLSVVCQGTDFEDLVVKLLNLRFFLL